MIIFESILKLASFFEASGAVVEIGSSLKPNHNYKMLTELILSKSVLHQVEII